MTLALSILDSADATGATAMVTGSDAGSSNTVYAAPLFQMLPFPVPWTAYGPRTGDGTVSLPVYPGYWFAYVSGTVSSVAVQTPPLVFQATTASDSLYRRILLGAQAKIQAICPLVSLTGPPGNIEASNVFEMPAINEAVLTWPCVVITPPLGQGEQVKTVVNLRDDIGYPFVVSILDRCSSNEAGDKEKTFYRWREQLSRLLRYQRLPGIAEVYTVALEPKAMVAWQPPEYEFFLSSLGFRAWSRETRFT